MAWLGFGLLLAGAVAVAIAWGWGALATYAFFAAIAGAVVFAARVGGDWLKDASSGRFRDGRGR